MPLCRELYKYGTQRQPRPCRAGNRSTSPETTGGHRGKHEVKPLCIQGGFFWGNVPGAPLRAPERGLEVRGNEPSKSPLAQASAPVLLPDAAGIAVSRSTATICSVGSKACVRTARRVLSLTLGTRPEGRECTATRHPTPVLPQPQKRGNRDSGGPRMGDWPRFLTG